jgi:drug/metabolite transporter (DMT)-like permease
MAVLLAYFSVVLIWATTPLTIQWSGDSLSFIAAVSLRMALAALLGLAINLALRRRLFAQPGAWQVYGAGALAIFPNMPVVYWSAQFIPSGLVALVFALSPFAMGLMSLALLKQNPFTGRRVMALVLALAGLVVIFYHQLHFNVRAAYGVGGIFLSCFLFALSSVLVKKSAVKVDAFNQALGALVFSLPGLLLLWWIVDGQIPLVISLKSLLAVGYLALLSSLLGGALFFYVLARMSPTAVSLITLMTPLLALILGAKFGHESLSWPLWCGAALVVAALLLYIDLSVGRLLLNSLRRGAWVEYGLQSLKREQHRYK